MKSLSKKVNGRPSLSLEALEPRILLSVLAGAGVDNPVNTVITDASGDDLLLIFAGPAGSQVEVLDTTGSGTFAGAAEDDIGSIEFTGTDANSSFIITDNNLGVGGDTIVIAGGPATEGIFTTGAEDMGVIILGVNEDLEPGGPHHVRRRGRNGHRGQPRGFPYVWRPRF